MYKGNTFMSIYDKTQSRQILCFQICVNPFVTAGKHYTPCIQFSKGRKLLFLPAHSIGKKNGFAEISLILVNLNSVSKGCFIYEFSAGSYVQHKFDQFCALLQAWILYHRGQESYRMIFDVANFIKKSSHHY